MLFFELPFFLFFAVTLGVTWTLRSNTARKTWLLLCSYAFYAAWDYRFLALILLSTAVDFVAARRIARARAGGRATMPWLVVSLVVNLSILGCFKYLGFFLESTAEILGVLGFSPHLPTLEIILPVGISFYTFQSMSYTIDVFRGQQEARTSWLDVALYVGFFPQLVAGPIVRASEFLPQLDERRRWDTVDARAAITRFAIGFFKKVYVADGIARIVDPYFASPAAYDVASAWVCAPLYAVQIYCDFSGYTDMAIGCAALLGYRIPQNFAFPYLGVSIADFWRRWHISLSSWLRDYLYISLGGNRGSRFATFRNLMLTMLLGGLWHGAEWGFVLWGAMHGLVLCVQRALSMRSSGLAARQGASRALLGMAFTFAIVSSLWVLFRAESVSDALTIWRALFLLEATGDRSVDSLIAWIWVPLVGLHVAAYNQVGASAWRSLPDWVFAAAMGVLVALGLWLFPVEFQPFIYFQF